LTRRSTLWRIDTLINNAGIYIGKPFTEYTVEDFNAVIAVNLAGFFHITRERSSTCSSEVVAISSMFNDAGRAPNAKRLPRWRR